MSISPIPLTSCSSAAIPAGIGSVELRPLGMQIPTAAPSAPDKPSPRYPSPTRGPTALCRFPAPHPLSIPRVRLMSFFDPDPLLAHCCPELSV
jgi:hypothetical protein